MVKENVGDQRQFYQVTERRLLGSAIALRVCWFGGGIALLQGVYSRSLNIEITVWDRRAIGGPSHEVHAT